MLSFLDQIKSKSASGAASGVAAGVAAGGAAGAALTNDVKSVDSIAEDAVGVKPSKKIGFLDAIKMRRIE